jgi:outer membrane protein assembly factor BamA
LRAIFFFIFFFYISSALIAQSLVVKHINFEGNKVTKSHILLAELHFNTGDQIVLDEIENVLQANATRLYNLQLFHWVKYAYEITEFNELIITFSMQERWFIWPIPIFSLADRNLNAWFNKLDFNRIDYGVHTAWYNFRGRNEQLVSNIQLGFNRKYELFYTIPQINKKQNIGLDFGSSLYQSHFIEYLNINALPQMLRLEDAFPIQRKYFRAGLINRNTVEDINTIHIELNRQTIADSVLALNPDFHTTGNNKTFMQMEIKKVMNKRKTFSYPLAGSYLEIALRQRFFFEQGESPSTRIQLNYAKYFKINDKNFYNVGVMSQYNLVNSISASENIALGYRQNLRGFDFYVIDGQHFIMLKQNLNTTLLGEKIIKINIIPSEKFNQIPLSIYGGVFGDVGYVSDNKYMNINVLSNKLLYGIGAGLHIVSYYDQVLTVECTLNSLRQYGIFVNTKFPF